MISKILYIFLILLLTPSFALTADVVELNKASLAELDLLVGVGPTIAQRIIDARPYTSVDDLSKVKGIGEKTLQDIKSQGLAYVSTGSQAPSTLETPTALIVEPQAMAPRLVTYPNGVIINEVLPAPEGPDETNEWIELYNQSDVNVNLQGWKIKDAKGGIATYAFSAGATIGSKGYIVLKRPQTKITLNNDEDGLSLIFPNGKVADSMSYKDAMGNQSYNKIGADWRWSRLQTPGAENTVGANYSGQTSLLKQEKSDISNTDTKGVAGISNALPFVKNIGANSNPWFLFIVAILIATISGVAILLFKLKLKKHVRS